MAKDKKQRRMRAKTFLYAGMGFCLAAIALLWLLNRWKLDFELKGEEICYVNYGDEYVDAGATACGYGTIFSRTPRQLAVQVTGSVDTSTGGEYKITYRAGYKGRTMEKVRRVLVGDFEAPVITLQENPELYTLPGQPYREEGFTAFDRVDGDMTKQVKVQEKDGIVYYTVADAAGNEARAQRRIIYRDPFGPKITLEGESRLVLTLGRPFEEPGFAVLDETDGDLTSAVVVSGVPDGSEVGEYTVVYEVKDAFGNTARAERTLVYEEPSPWVTLSGSSEMTLYIGEAYREPGYSAGSDLEGDLTQAVSVTGHVDTSSPGVYILTYSVSNRYGRQTCAERSVRVKTLPVQNNTTMTGDKIIYLTFDDGPGPHTERLLNLLASYHVKATFFVTNTFPQYQSLIGRAFREGHAIGVHTLTHDFSKIYAGSDAFFADLEAMNDIIEAQTGARSRLMRFAGGSSNGVSRKYCQGIMSRLVNEVTERGYAYFDWNVDSNDAGGTKTTSGVRDNVVKGIQGKRVSVVLQHDIKSYSVDAVINIIEWGLENGYTFKPLNIDSYGAHHSVRN